MSLKFAPQFRSQNSKSSSAVQLEIIVYKSIRVWLNVGDDREHSLSFHLLCQHSFPLHSEQYWLLDGKSSQPSVSVSGSGK